MISREDILHLAQLARLSVAEAEIAPLQKDVSSILEFVSQLSSVDANVQSKGVPSVPQHRNSMRDDATRLEGDQLWLREEAVRAQFPTRQKDYNVVRKIIQKDE